MAKPVAPRGYARDRLLQAAIALFNQHGVSGTSLQMIADKLGISKASVYYQFRSKDEIVLAVLHPMLDDLTRLIRIAESLSTPATQRETCVIGLVELSVRHRHVAGVFFGDPAVGALVGSQPEFAETADRLIPLLTGPNPDPAQRVFIRMMVAGIYVGATDPQLRDIPDTDIYETLLTGAKRLVPDATILRQPAT